MLDMEHRVHILHGEDEFSIAAYVQQYRQSLGESTMAEMNTAWLDGRAHTLEDLVMAVNVLPFLTPCRLVVFDHPLELARTASQQERLTSILTQIPPTTLLLMRIDHLLTSKRDREQNRVHWLEHWALEHPDIAVLCPFPLPAGAELGRWIQARARVHGGQFALPAANQLAQLVGPELRILDHEIQKLLAYVNFARPVEADDVQNLTPKTADVGDFALLDALRNRNTRLAMQVLRRRLEDEDPILLFHQVVSQFRLLLQTREILELGGRKEDVSRALNIHPFRAQLAVEHARRFSMADLEAIYHRLFELDVAIKTGEMEGELALELLVTELTIGQSFT